MSRIGNKPISVPSGVKIAVASDKIDVQGPKGKLSLAVPRGISFEQKDGVLNVKRDRTITARFTDSLARWSPTRSSWRYPGLQEGHGHRRRRLPR